MLTPFKHQTEIAKEALEKLRKFGIVYLAMEERTGKTLTSLLMCEQTIAQNILIVTKKKALSGWNSTLLNFPHKKTYTLLNFESLHKLAHTNFDIVIVDEAHYALSAYPKPSLTARRLKVVCSNKLVIYLSATPNAESYSQLFHQFFITKYSPFKGFKNFYEWHRKFGIEAHQFLGARIVKKYNKCKEEKVKEATKHLFITMSRKELGFKIEPTDNVVFIELENSTKKMLDTLFKAKELKQFNYIADSITKEISALHQIEGGTLKVSLDSSIELGNLEKINFIKQQYGDVESVAIMYNFVAEKALLAKHFKKASLFQSTASAEGVDLSHFEKLVIYSMNFSASKFIQRRARQCNLNRETPIEVDFLLVKGGISEMAYEAIVKNKLSLTQSYYNTHISSLNYK